MSEISSSQIKDRIKVATKIAVVSHIRADGDAVGSVLGLGLALQSTGKNINIILPDGVPSNFRFLTGSNLVTSQLQDDVDLIIVVDSSDLGRIGNVLGDRKPDINIDHHATNLMFAEINLVIADESSTCAIIANLLKEWEFEFDQFIAEALLTGIVTDTLGFRTTNVSSDTLRVAAWLMDKGANLAHLYDRALIQRSLESAYYWAHGLQNLQRQGRIIWTTLTLDGRKKASYPGNDDADLVNLLSSIDDADIAIIFVEQKKGKVKVSWRARPGWDISKIALQFNGGGHSAASGAEIEGELQEVQQKVLQASQDFYNHQVKLNNNNTGN